MPILSKAALNKGLKPWPPKEAWVAGINWTGITASWTDVEADIFTIQEIFEIANQETSANQELF